LQAVPADRLSRPELLRDGPRDDDAVLGEDVPDEAAAVEPGRVAAAIPIGAAAEGKGDPDHAG
jgi:hypothetical protein